MGNMSIKYYNFHDFHESCTVNIAGTHVNAFTVTGKIIRNLKIYNKIELSITDLCKAKKVIILLLASLCRLLLGRKHTYLQLNLLLYLGLLLKYYSYSNYK